MIKKMKLQHIYLICFAVALTTVLCIHSYQEAKEALPLTGGAPASQEKKDSKATLVIQPVYLNIGDKFEPLSGVVSATDENGKDIRSNVTTTSHVNTDEAGTNYITYLAPYGDNQYVSAVGLVIVLAK